MYRFTMIWRLTGIMKCDSQRNSTDAGYNCPYKMTAACVRVRNLINSQRPQLDWLDCARPRPFTYYNSDLCAAGFGARATREITFSKIFFLSPSSLYENYTGGRNDPGLEGLFLRGTKEATLFFHLLYEGSDIAPGDVYLHSPVAGKPA